MTVAELEAFCREIRAVTKNSDNVEIKVVTERGTIKRLGKARIFTREGFPTIELK